MYVVCELSIHGGKSVLESNNEEEVAIFLVENEAYDRSCMMSTRYVLVANGKGIAINKFVETYLDLDSIETYKNHICGTCRFYLEIENSYGDCDLNEPTYPTKTSSLRSCDSWKKKATKIPH